MRTEIVCCGREIQLLQKCRTRLVVDAVTGKLDVRPAARQLTAEPETPSTPVDDVEPIEE